MRDGTRRPRRLHWRDVIFDGVAPLALLVLGVVDAVTGFFSEPVGNGPVLTSLIPGAIACLLLVLRRYRPLLTLVLVLAVLLVPTFVLPTSLTYWDEFMVWVIALYSCGRHATRSRAFVALGVSAVAMAILPLEFAELRDPGGVVFNSALLAAGFSIGMLARSWAGYRERIIRSAGERAVAEERASRRERERLARELHDVISHTITVIVMQAGGARLASASDPDAAVDALVRIEALGRDSLAELRALLDVLRGDDGETADTAPQPTLADVPELCSRMRALGFPVRLRTEGDTGSLPAGVQLTGFRVVQEGLTNVLKHAGTVDTEVVIDHAALRGLVVRISSAPSRSAPGAGETSETSESVLAARLPGASRGLPGLRERVGALGGTLTTDHRADGGFVICAELPVMESAV